MLNDAQLAANENYTDPYPCNELDWISQVRCAGMMIYQRDEYGGLSGGGDYAIFKCNGCERTGYVQLPD